MRERDRKKENVSEVKERGDEVQRRKGQEDAQRKGIEIYEELERLSSKIEWIKISELEQVMEESGRKKRKK